MLYIVFIYLFSCHDLCNVHTVLRVTHEDGHSEGLNETERRPVIDLRCVYVKKINSSEVNECEIGGDEKLVIIQLCGLCDLFS